MYMVASRIRVTLSAAMSIDGKIATGSGDSALSSRSDLKRVHRMRAKHDAILVGINTVRTDNPLLTVRHVRGKNPIRIILDMHASLLPSSKIAKTAKNINTIVIVSSAAPKSKLTRLSKMGIRIVAFQSKNPTLPTILARLQTLGIRTLLVEGGSKTNWEFVSKNLVDELIVCIVPRLLGGGVSLVGGSGFARIALSFKMRLYSCKRSNNELIVRYFKL